MSPQERQILQQELSRLQAAYASHRVDRRFGNKAIIPLLKATRKQIKKIEAELRSKATEEVNA